MAGASLTNIRAGLLGVLLALAATAAVAQTRVNSIAIDGNQRIPDSTIISLVDFEAGQVVTDGQINDALQRILASGLFETVDIVPAGNGLRIVVVERPTINRISIEGNERLDDEVLMSVVTSTPPRFSLSSRRSSHASCRAISARFSARK